jgi:Fe-S-cluster containining protein
MSTEKKFYQGGLRFECQGEGKCCASRGEYGYVYLSFNDRRRLAAHFGITATEFTIRYTQKEDGLYQLKYAGRDCPFFADKRCSVYEARPWQCRTWPFWPENMNRTVWESEVASYCPGAGKGRLYSAEEIEEIIAKKKDVCGVPVNEAAGRPRG